MVPWVSFSVLPLLWWESCDRQQAETTDVYIFCLPMSGWEAFLFLFGSA